MKLVTNHQLCVLANIRSKVANDAREMRDIVDRNRSNMKAYWAEQTHKRQNAVIEIARELEKRLRVNHWAMTAGPRTPFPVQA